MAQTVFADTYALVLCGGQSSRMGTDKSLLQYYNKPQRYHVYDMLMPLCQKVFISCSAEQAEKMQPGYDFIPDAAAYNNTGPMAALLSAWELYPQKNMLLVGCDYPFLKTGELELFSRLCKNAPVSFYNQEAAIYESMLAWYPFTCHDELKLMFKEKHLSLQELLKKYDAVKYLPGDVCSIKSTDTPGAFEEALKKINAR